MNTLAAILAIVALAGERLYVVDNNQVRILAWPGYEPLESVGLDIAVANDIAVAGDGSFRITDTARGQVVARSAAGTLQVTPGGGPLVRFGAAGDIEVFGGAGVSSANHGYAARLGLALIPTGFDNTVIAIRLPRQADAETR